MGGQHSGDPAARSWRGWAKREEEYIGDGLGGWGAGSKQTSPPPLCSFLFPAFTRTTPGTQCQHCFRNEAAPHGCTSATESNSSPAAPGLGPDSFSRPRPAQGTGLTEQVAKHQQTGSSLSPLARQAVDRQADQYNVLCGMTSLSPQWGCQRKLLWGSNL